MKLGKILLYFIAFTFFSCSTLTIRVDDWQPPYGSHNLDFVKVLLGKHKGKITIESKGVIKVFDVNDILIKEALHSITLDTNLLRARITLVGQSSPLIYNGSPYRGIIEIVPEIESKDRYIVNVLPIEEYLYSVVPSEVPSNWPVDSLKAQAIAARTYLIYHLLNLNKPKKPYDIEATVNFQVYSGMRKENPRTTAAVDSTSNAILIYDNKPIHAFFHSNSGGVTEAAENVWGAKMPYLIPVRSKFCKTGNNYFWKQSVPQSYIDRKLAYLKIGTIKNVLVLGRTESKRVDLLEVYGEERVVKMTGYEFRQKLGSTYIKSLRFGIERNLDGFNIKGMGFGHGVGLSQWGSYGMAKNNYTYLEILTHYYRGVQLASIPY